MINFSHYWGSLLDIPQVSGGTEPILRRTLLTVSALPQLAWVLADALWYVFCAKVWKEAKTMLAVLSTSAFLPHIYVPKRFSISGATCKLLTSFPRTCNLGF